MKWREAMKHLKRKAAPPVCATFHQSALDVAINVFLTNCIIHSKVPNFTSHFLPHAADHCSKKQ
eukprot:scaffold318227_cov15-Tisochrysis_lutea.AAC.1